MPEVPYTTAKAWVAEGLVTEIELEGEAMTLHLAQPRQAPGRAAGDAPPSTVFTSRLPASGDPGLLPLVEAQEVQLVGPIGIDCYQERSSHLSPLELGPTPKYQHLPRNYRRRSGTLPAMQRTRSPASCRPTSTSPPSRRRLPRPSDRCGVREAQALGRAMCAKGRHRGAVSERRVGVGLIICRDIFQRR